MNTITATPQKTTADKILIMQLAYTSFPKWSNLEFKPAFSNKWKSWENNGDPTWEWERYDYRIKSDLTHLSGEEDTLEEPETEEATPICSTAHDMETYIRIAFALQGVTISPAFAYTIMLTYEEIKAKGGDMNLEDTANIELKVKNKYQREENEGK